MTKATKRFLNVVVILILVAGGWLVGVSMKGITETTKDILNIRVNQISNDTILLRQQIEFINWWRAEQSSDIPDQLRERMSYTIEVFKSHQEDYSYQTDLGISLIEAQLKIYEDLIKQAEDLLGDIKEKLKVGMSYSAVVELLGEPDSNIGFGKIVASWKLTENEWFVPIFEGDKVIKIEFSDKK